LNATELLKEESYCTDVIIASVQEKSVSSKNRQVRMERADENNSATPFKIKSVVQCIFRFLFTATTMLLQSHFVFKFCGGKDYEKYGELPVMPRDNLKQYKWLRCAGVICW